LLYSQAGLWWSSCLSFPSTGTTDMNHYAWLVRYLLLFHFVWLFWGLNSWPHTCINWATPLDIPTWLLSRLFKVFFPSVWF
jgi:hypothetical protein